MKQPKDLLYDNDFIPYWESFRAFEENNSICIVKKDNNKYIAVIDTTEQLNFTDIIAEYKINDVVLKICQLNWDNYMLLREPLNLKPSVCSKKISFGTGDRLGLVTAAHINAFNNTPQIFPVLAQQSPRELEKENRTFKSVLLDAVMGILECGYMGSFGADADHIKSINDITSAINAGYSMYTIDISEETNTITNIDYKALSDESKKIVDKYAHMQIKTSKYYYNLSKDKFIESASIYERAMEKIVRFSRIIEDGTDDFDLEVSIDEGNRTTSYEDHIFCAEYLNMFKVKFTSLAPKFIGEFQKAIDYIGDISAFTENINLHAEIARFMGGYKISLHSGSDKFSIYDIFKAATNNYYHIKTSGTSWLVAVKTIKPNIELFKKMYNISLANLDNSKKFYQVNITKEDFITNPSNEELETILSDPNVIQLLHISYGVILKELKSEVYLFLNQNEKLHYKNITKHIKKHLI